MKKKLSILIVENDRVDVLIAECMLQNLDGSIVVDNCENGEQALAYLYDITKELPDLILLDINMPVMNGKEFLKKQATIGSFSNIPVVMVSSSGLQSEKDECFELGATDFIEKPLTVEKLEESFRQNSILHTNRP